MSQLTIGVFPNQPDAKNAVVNLLDNGINPQDISIITKNIVPIQKNATILSIRIVDEKQKPGVIAILNENNPFQVSAIKVNSQT